MSWIRSWLSNRSKSDPGHHEAAAASESRACRANFGVKELVPCLNASIDIMAIHGLNGDREESWRADNGDSWLSDFLPEDMEYARVLTYGYDAYVHGRKTFSVQTLSGHARDLVAKLVMYRKSTQSTDRPMIFVAHNLGGIVLKFALIHASNCHENHLSDHRDIFKQTEGIVFLGTPNQGAKDIYLGQNVKGIPASKINDIVAKHLESNSEMLQRQIALYLPISKNFTTCYLYENVGTIVPKATAVLQGATNVEGIGLNTTHDQLGRFQSKDDDDYQTVLGSLRNIMGQMQSKPVSITTSEQVRVENLILEETVMDNDPIT